MQQHVCSSAVRHTPVNTCVGKVPRCINEVQGGALPWEPMHDPVL